MLKSLIVLVRHQSKTIFITTSTAVTATTGGVLAQRIASNGSNRYYASASSSASSAGNQTKTLLQRYEDLLLSDPVKTKMVTGSLLWGLGDLVAQMIPQFVSDDTDDNETTTVGKKINYDLIRTGRAVFFGFALHAPLSHVHFNFLESLTVRLGITGNVKVPIFKAFMEQFVYWSWISNGLYHSAMGAMQGKTPQQVYQKLEDVLWETQKAQWVFWIPVQLLNFRFVPVRHQLNVVLTTSVVWTALLSAWYPPENDEQNNSRIEKITNNEIEKK